MDQIQRPLRAADPRYERWRWGIFALTWLVYAGYYLTRQSFAVAKVAFADDPNITMTREDYGIVDSSYLIAYAVGQFLWGSLGDRLGPKRILVAGMLLGIFASICSGFSTGLIAFAVFAVVQGMGQATGWPNVVKTMSSWFSLRERGRVVGVWCTHYAVGAVAALILAGYMMNLFGAPRPPGEEGSAIVPYWPAGFWGPAAVLGVILALVVVFLRNRPQDVGLPTIEEYRGEVESVLRAGDRPEDEIEGSWEVFAKVLRVPGVWYLAFSYFGIKLTRYALYFWGPKYISESLGSGAFGSGVMAAWLPFGGALGVIVSGCLSDKAFQSRRMPVTVLALVLTAALMMMGLRPIANRTFMCVFFFFIGFFLFGPDSIISATAAMDFGTKKAAATAAGIVNGVGSVGAILGGWLPGKITREDNWAPVFWVFVVGLLISAAILAPMWNTKPPTGDRGRTGPKPRT